MNPYGSLKNGSHAARRVGGAARRALAAVALALPCATALGLFRAASVQGAEITNADSSAPAPAVSSALQGPALLQALRAGGLVIYFRHTATDFSRNDSAMQDYADCANQRLLSAQGRDDAVRLGREIRALKLAVAPPSEVLASPMCRTTEHATLTFGRARPVPQLREGQGGDYPELKRLLATPLPKGRNRWIVGHGNPFRAVAGPPHLAEGEAAIVRPGIDRWTELARLSVDQWASLTNR